MKILILLIIFAFIVTILTFYLMIYKMCLKHYREKHGINKDTCYKMLKDLKTITHKHNIFFYLSEGTALGIYRDGDLLEWDDDVDVGIFSQDKERFFQLVVPEMRKMGYIFNVETMPKMDLHFFLKDHHMMDVEIVNPKLNCISKMENPCYELIPHLQFIKKTWRGLELNLPKQSYYEYLYGKDWMIPKRGNKPIN